MALTTLGRTETHLPESQRDASPTHFSVSSSPTEEAAEGYKAMDERRATKVLLTL